MGTVVGEITTEDEMTDDLFWPPLSADDEGRPGDGDSAGHPTASYPTQPLEGFGGPSGDPYGGPSGDPYGGSGGSSGGARQPRRIGTAAVVAATAFVFGAGGVAVGAELLNNNDNSSTPAVGAPAANVTSSALNTSPKTFAGIAARVLPSVVSINVKSTNEDDTGSGIVLRSDGYILTNNHVVAAASSGGTVSVTFNDGSSASARIVGTDTLDDLAVVRVSKTGLSPASLGNSGAIQVGDPVLAVGSPLGLAGTVTSGIVSALNRPVETQQEQQQSSPFGLGNGGSTQAQQPTVIDAIQTDAAINPGNSGGALVDAAGQVIGINSAIASLGDNVLGSQSGNIGVGFAIPINEAKTVAAELIASGHAVHPLLGVSLLDQTTSAGADRAIVHTVTSGSPAAKAGIKAGDVIVAVDGLPTQGADAVIAAIRSHSPGEHVTVTVQRGGSTKTVTAVLTTESSSQG
jgi:putative serine protease PepD